MWEQIAKFKLRVIQVKSKYMLVGMQASATTLEKNMEAS
jgi:hypothetical protein